MTRVVLQEGPNGLEGFKVTGHSGYGEAGSDIVCAAVSILTTTCVNALESVAGVVPQVIQRDEPVLLEVTLPKGLSRTGKPFGKPMPPCGGIDLL